MDVFQNRHIFKLVDHDIAQIQHNCLISGGRAHIKVCKTMAVPRIGHFELAIIGRFSRIASHKYVRGLIREKELV